MLIVTNYASTRTEPFFTTSAPLFEQDTLGNLTLEFTVNKTNNEAGFNLLQEEAIVTAANYDFRVKQIIDDKPGRKTILAISTFFDLAYQFKDTTYGGTHSSQEFVNYLLADTGWTVTCDFSDTATIDKFGSKNIIQCVNQICDAFNCEFEILPNKRVHFSKSLGPDNNAQYRYGHNIKALSRKIDTNHLRTQITATGKEDLTVTYTSPNHTLWGIRKADPISDERFTIAEHLMKKAKDSLIDYPEVSFELDTLELLDKQLGEKVWLIYEPIEGLELQTRILQRTCIVDELTDELKTITVKLGNSLPRSMSDNELDSEEELADTKGELEEVINESKKEFRSAITQTDNRITIEVEQLNRSIARIDVKADSIDLSVNNRITNEVAAINIRADQIQSTVSSQGAQIHGMDTRVANAESTITQQSWQISQKVSQTDYNGNTISSMINQTATDVLIRASKIKFVGEIYALSDINGNLGTIHTGTLNSVNINSANINISEDVYIGNTLQIGPSYMDTSPKTINFGGGTGGYIQHSYDTIELSAPNGATVNGKSVITSNLPGMYIAFNNNQAYPRLYIRDVWGLEYGYVDLTK
ncbi:phage tail spike protein [Lysinibacillus xylanilyticus]|uniref:phage tail protein n=1 Tax=Lysinibacillus xylanilyticus TaxID=582475 RepID=UPI003D0866C1